MLFLVFFVLVGSYDNCRIYPLTLRCGRLLHSCILSVQVVSLGNYTNRGCDQRNLILVLVQDQRNVYEILNGLLSL